MVLQFYWIDPVWIFARGGLHHQQCRGLQVCRRTFRMFSRDCREQSIIRKIYANMGPAAKSEKNRRDQR